MQGDKLTVSIAWLDSVTTSGRSSSDEKTAAFRAALDQAIVKVGEDGTELRYNSEDPWLPDLVICRPEVAFAVLDAAESAS